MNEIALRFMNKTATIKNYALRVVLPYVVVAALWIYFSDWLLYATFSDVETLAELQTYKGMFYVLATGLLLYFLIQRTTRELTLSRERIKRLLLKEKEARKRIEKARLKLEYILQEAPSPICILDGPDHIFKFANHSYKEMLGNRQIIGQPVKKVIPELEGQGYIELLDHVYETGEIHLGKGTTYNIIKDGKKHTYFRDFIYCPLKDEEENTYGIFVQINDITEQINTLNELKDTLGEKEILLRELHHRVKNNLAVIAGLIDLQANEITTADAAQPLLNTQTRIHTIAGIHEVLYRENDLKNIPLPKLINKLAETRSGLYGEQSEIEVKVEDITLNVNQAVPLALMLNEIFSLYNAISARPNQQLLVHSDLTKLPSTCLSIRVPQENDSFVNCITTSTKTFESNLIELWRKQLEAELYTSRKDQKLELSICFTKEDITGSSSNL